jgi:tetratricopeptide (TPR) repeat protein
VISTSRGLIHRVRTEIAQYGFASIPNTSPSTNLLMKRADDLLAVTCLDSISRLRSHYFSVVDIIRKMSQDISLITGARTLFVASFALGPADAESLANARISLIPLEQLAAVATILGTEHPSTTGTNAQQQLLSSQMTGMCRRFAQAYAAAGDLDSAICWRQRQAELRPRSTEAHWTLADLHSKRGALEDAALSAERVLQLGSDNLPVMLLLVDIKRRQGDIAAAARLITSAVALFPNSDAARKLAAALGATPSPWPVGLASHG